MKKASERSWLRPRCRALPIFHAVRGICCNQLDGSELTIISGKEMSSRGDAENAEMTARRSLALQAVIPSGACHERRRMVEESHPPGFSRRSRQCGLPTEQELIQEIEREKTMIARERGVRYV